MGDNAATNAPRMLTRLAEADRRGAQLVHINPLLEAASRRTIVPHEFVDMATFHTTEIGTMNVQVRIGGDMALLRGVAKAVLEAAAADPAVLDQEFIERYTNGFDEYRALCEATPWADLARDSGVDEPAIRALADGYTKSGRGRAHQQGRPACRRRKDRARQHWRGDLPLGDNQPVRQDDRARQRRDRHHRRETVLLTATETEDQRRQSTRREDRPAHVDPLAAGRGARR